MGQGCSKQDTSAQKLRAKIEITIEVDDDKIVDLFPKFVTEANMMFGGIHCKVMSLHCEGTDMSIINFVDTVRDKLIQNNVTLKSIKMCKDISTWKKTDPVTNYFEYRVKLGTKNGMDVLQIMNECDCLRELKPEVVRNAYDNNVEIWWYASNSIHTPDTVKKLMRDTERCIKKSNIKALARVFHYVIYEHLPECDF
jgi:hypothetical protein